MHTETIAKHTHPQALGPLHAESSTAAHTLRHPVTQAHTPYTCRGLTLARWTQTPPALQCFLSPGPDHSQVSGHHPWDLAFWGKASPKSEPTVLQRVGSQVPDQASAGAPCAYGQS